MIGDGLDPDVNPFRPALVDIVTDIAWSATDGRTTHNQPGASMLVNCDPTPVQHTLIIADARVEYIGES